uniref:Uncharacterized protein n=1 Tax=Aplanochytrium stocchinoi TaxID=215587 RepID=A0A7S3UYD8_9STRA
MITASSIKTKGIEYSFEFEPPRKAQQAEVAVSARLVSTDCQPISSRDLIVKFDAYGSPVFTYVINSSPKYVSLKCESIEPRPNPRLGLISRRNPLHGVAARFRDVLQSLPSSTGTNAAVSASALVSKS